MIKNYVFLAKRDKSDIKVLTILKGGEHPATRVEDIKKLSLSPELEQKISVQVKEHKMLWELWIESAENFEELKKKLIKRGFRKLPMNMNALFTLDYRNTRQFTPLRPPVKTMLRKN